MTTPSLEAYINDLIDQRLRQMQTAYPAEVIAYDSSTSTATIKPLFLEAWRGPNDERITEPFENEEDTHVENVLVMHPRTSAFRIALPVSPGDTGLAVVAKYSLDRFRSDGVMSDPGDMRKFTMSGSVFFPVNLYASDLDASDDDAFVTISQGGTAEFVALANLVNSELSKIDTTFGSIVFTVDTGDGTGLAGTIGTPYSAGTVDSATLKAD